MIIACIEGRPATRISYVRTKATATPAADAYNLPVSIYGATALTVLVDSVKACHKKNVLIMGHSGAVDDAMSRLCGRPP